jgi:hypothetical protein
MAHREARDGRAHSGRPEVEMLKHSSLCPRFNMSLEQQRDAVESEIARLQRLLQELTQQQMELNTQILAATSGAEIHTLEALEQHFRKSAEKVVCLVESWYAPAERRAYMGTKEPLPYQSSLDTRVARRVFHFGRSAGRLEVDEQGGVAFCTLGPAFTVRSASDDDVEIEQSASISLHKNTDPVLDLDRRVDCAAARCGERDCFCASYSIVVGADKISQIVHELPAVEHFFQETYVAA